MRRIAQRRRFRDDVKRQKRRGKNIGDLIAAVELLAEAGALPPAYRAHKLSGAWRGVWECHIEPDWLPNAKCDALALQVIPSPLPCAQLRQAIVSRGKMIAELVGLPLLQDSSGQIMLIPTRANACVLIGMRIAYTP